MVGLMKVNLVLGMLLIAVGVTTSEFSDTQDAEVGRLLKKLNKPAIKSIKSPDGDIIDCVHLKNHPIYDHPLFKNHTIQMRPTFSPEGWTNESLNTEKQSMVTQLWQINGKCPKDSIPIRRTRKEDILRAGSIKRYKNKYPTSTPKFKPANSTSNNKYHQYVTFKVKNGTFHGAKAIINVWKPNVQTPNEFSLAQMWIAAGPPSKLETIEVGWQVYPEKYGDYNTRLFIFWTADGYKKKKCYNLDWKGFVPVNQKFVIGGTITSVSTIDGPQYVLPTSVMKDPISGNWWLRIDDENIGYWPSSLFKELKNSANLVQWGGEIVDFKVNSQHTTTNMGSGRFAEEGYQKASFFRNLEVVDENNIIKRPSNGFAGMTEENCYNIKTQVDEKDGVYFFYGGPGRNVKCL